VHCEAKRKSIERKTSSQCHDRVANTTQAAQGDIRREPAVSRLKTRKSDSADGDVSILFLRITGRIVTEVDNQPYDGGGFEGLPDDPYAANLHASEDRLDRTRHETTVPYLDPGSIVADQALEQACLICMKHDFPSQGRFARPRCPPDEKSGLSHDNAAGMDRLS
jgi:hypothetical protein